MPIACWACKCYFQMVEFSPVWSFSHVRLFVIPWTATGHASLSINESVMLSNHQILCHHLFLLPSVFIASGSFQMSQLFASGGQSIGVSALASVLPVNIQDWFPVGWTGWSPCSPRDPKESSTTSQFESINSSALSFLYSPTLTSIHDYWKNRSFDQMDLCCK